MGNFKYYAIIVAFISFIVIGVVALLNLNPKKGDTARKKEQPEPKSNSESPVVMYIIVGIVVIFVVVMVYRLLKSTKIISEREIKRKIDERDRRIAKLSDTQSDWIKTNMDLSKKVVSLQDKLKSLKENSILIEQPQPTIGKIPTTGEEMHAYLIDEQRL